MRRSVFTIIGGVVLLLSLEGCIPGLDKTYTTPSDTSAAHLSLGFFAGVEDATSWTASAAFTEKTSVKFAKGEQVACEGTALHYDSEDGIFSQSLPLKPRGATYTCTYTSGKNATSWQFTLPDPVQILAPHAGDTLDRKSVTIQYTGAAGVGLQVEADNEADKSTLGVNNPTQDVPGTYQFSASSLSAGAGRLTIHSVRHETPQGTGFARLDLYEDVSRVVIPVTWI